MKNRLLSLLLCVCATSASAQPASDPTVSFVTPSQNIFCILSEKSGAHCEIFTFTPTNHPAPGEDCGVDWGGQFDLGSTGRTVMGCYGDTKLSADPPVLDYGHSAEAAGIVCASERGGLTCTNRDGHGFSLSRARQRLF